MEAHLKVTPEWALRVAGGLLLAAVGWLAGSMVVAWEPWPNVGLAAVGILLGLLATPYITVRPLHWVWRHLVDLPLSTFLIATGGLLLGLLGGVLLSLPLAQLPGRYGSVTPLVATAVLSFLGIALALAREKELRDFLPESRQTGTGTRTTRASREISILLDTSAIIDGRIADIGQTGFVQGTLVIPRFVLDELRHIADSSDALRRNRGRRGLEMLNKLRKDSNVPLQVLDVDMGGGIEVDGKLVRLAKSMQAPIITTDFNLNRVAELQGVKALNINELANSLKPVVLPGEDMLVRVIQEGKEPGQGVGFLDDGTMVVVEGGRRYINSHLDVSITRVLQTAAGRIIFAQPKDGTRNGTGR